MAGPIRIRFGSPTNGRQISEAVNAATILEIARAGANRVKGRVSHPSAQALKAESRGSRRADIAGTRGGPGIIRPVRARALYWPGASHPVAFVRGVGFEPLIKAEVGRVTTADIDLSPISAAATGG